MAVPDLLSPKRNDNPLEDLQYECPWDYRPYVAAPYVALDTETTVVGLSQEIPRLVLATVSNGRRHIILRPQQVARFIVESLQGASVVGFNTQFDWWVIRQYLEQVGDSSPISTAALTIWDSLPEQGRLHDAMLLDFLVRLADASDQGVLRMRDLGLVVKGWLGWKIDKEDPYRMRFGELLETPDWKKVDPGFFEYAVKDAVATWHLWGKLWRTARGSTNSPYGMLTEGLQVRASIVLSQVGRNGFAIDPERVAAVRERLRGKVAELAGKLEAEGYADIFATDTVKKRLGQRLHNPKTGTPKIAQAPLRAHLQRAAAEAGLEEEEIKRTPKGNTITTALDYWRDLLPEHPLVSYWSEMLDTSKLLQFIVQLDGEESIHASYRTLVRTGRTSSARPNIQQMPREPWFRELFVARPGHKLVIVDYAAIELRTLAAVLLDRYGESKLAEVIRQGVDPHAYTAAMIIGLTPEQFAALKETDPALYKSARQKAKPVNFGVPGGLGAARLSMYAKTQYGVAMSVQEAGELRERLITVVYPELSRYLEHDPLPSLSAALMCSPERLKQVWEEIFKEPVGGFLGVGNVLSGRKKKDGSDYKPWFVDRVWYWLYKCNRNPRWHNQIIGRKASESFRRSLVGETATTLTGRIRSGADYGEARNTVFQGLAADGAKVALWNLFRWGFRVVAFVHDEAVIETPAERAVMDKEVIEQIMVESMQSVLGHDIPVAVEGHISDRWVK